MIRYTRHSFVALVLAALLIPTGAVASTADTSAVSERDERIQKQMAQLLQEDEMRQEHALQIVSHFAHTEQYDASFFEPLVAPLLEIVADSDSDGLRIMAISTLSSIGTAPAFEGLEAQVEAIESERVQAMAERAVVQYKLDRAESERQRFTGRIQQHQW